MAHLSLTIIRVFSQRQWALPVQTFVLLGTFSSLENKQAVTADSVINAKLLIVAVTALQSFTGCLAEDG